MTIIHRKCTATLIDSMGDDLRVSNAARVSFDKWKADFDRKDERLILYLARHGHWTPFGHVMITMRLQMPIFTARQWIKSDKGCIRNDNGVESEVSRRYVDSDPEFYIPEVFHERPEGGIKQGAGEVHEFSQDYVKHYSRSMEDHFEDYIDNIMSGMAPEEARMFLPQNTMTTIVETGSLVYYARVCKLRMGHGAQGAVSQLASEVYDIADQIAPRSWAALMETTA